MVLRTVRIATRSLCPQIHLLSAATPSSPRPYLPVPWFWIDPINVWPPFRRSSRHAPPTWRGGFPAFSGTISSPTVENRIHVAVRSRAREVHNGNDARGVGTHLERAKKRRSDPQPRGTVLGKCGELPRRVGEGKTIGRPLHLRWTRTEDPLPWLWMPQDRIPCDDALPKQRRTSARRTAWFEARIAAVLSHVPGHVGGPPDASKRSPHHPRRSLSLILSKKDASQLPILLSLSNPRIVPESSVRCPVETVEDPVPWGSWERAFQRSKTRCSNTRQERRFALNSFASGLHRRVVQERKGRDVRIYDATTQRHAGGTLPSRPWHTRNRERGERVSKERVRDRNRS